MVMKNTSHDKGLVAPLLYKRVFKFHSLFKMSVFLKKTDRGPKRGSLHQKRDPTSLRMPRACVIAAAPLRFAPNLTQD